MQIAQKEDIGGASGVWWHSAIVFFQIVQARLAFRLVFVLPFFFLFISCMVCDPVTAFAITFRVCLALIWASLALIRSRYWLLTSPTLRIGLGPGYTLSTSFSPFPESKLETVATGSIFDIEECISMPCRCSPCPSFLHTRDPV